MPFVDLRDASRERARVNNELHPLPRRLDGRVGDRLAKAEVVDHDVHEATLSPGYREVLARLEQVGRKPDELRVVACGRAVGEDGRVL